MNTEQFIHSYLERVYADFSTATFCSINNAELNMTSYATPVNQQKYILKYFAAYFCEYYLTYADVVRRTLSKNLKSIDVMSIGCGCGIDFYALERFLLDSSLNDFKVNYHGIDGVDWMYRPNSTAAPISLIFEKTFFSNITAKDILHTNVFVFPKSLTELNLSELSKFGKIIAAHSKEDRIFFVNSYITNDSARGEWVDGKRQFQEIANSLVSGGYATEDNCWKHNFLVKHDEYLNETFSFFGIPPQIDEVLKNLKICCDKKPINGYNCNFCDVKIIPMRKGKYLAFNIIEFVRRK